MTAESRAGIVTVLFIAALVAFLIFLRGGVEFRDRGYPLHIVVPNAGGILTGAPVQMAGVTVGSVTAVALTPDRRATITVRIRAGVPVPVGSRFAVASSGLLGDRFIAITPEPGDLPALEPGTVVAGEPPFSVDELVDRVVAVAARAEETLASVNRLLTDPTLTDGLRESVANAREATVAARRVAEHVERTTRRLDRMIAREVPAIAAQLRTMAANLADASADVQSLVRDAGLLVRDVSAEGETARQIRRTVAAIERAADGIDRMVRDLRGLVNEQEVAAVRASLAEARAAVTEARQAVTEGRAAIGEGRALIARASQTVERVDRLLPERLEVPPVRRFVRLEYGLWYDGSGVGQDVVLTLRPDAATAAVLSFREQGGTSRLGMQMSSRVAERLRLRYGLLDSFLGLGADYQVSPRLTSSVDLTNINRVTMNVYLRYLVAPEYGLTLRGTDLLVRPGFGIGIVRLF